VNRACTAVNKDVVMYTSESSQIDLLQPMALVLQENTKMKFEQSLHWCHYRRIMNQPTSQTIKNLSSIYARILNPNVMEAKVV